MRPFDPRVHSDKDAYLGNVPAAYTEGAVKHDLLLCLEADRQPHTIKVRTPLGGHWDKLYSLFVFIFLL